MSFNSDTFALMLRLALAMIVILLVIWLIAVGTPFLAKLVDKLLGKAKIDQGASFVPKDPERAEGENENSDTEYRVYDIYEGTPSYEKENDEKKD